MVQRGSSSLKTRDQSHRLGSRLTRSEWFLRTVVLDSLEKLVFGQTAFKQIF